MATLRSLSTPTPSLCVAIATHGLIVLTLVCNAQEEVTEVRAIRDRLSPHVKIDINEIGVILPDDNVNDPVPFPNMCALAGHCVCACVC